MEAKTDLVVFNSEIKNQKGGQVVVIMRIEEMPFDEKILCSLSKIMDEFSKMIDQNVNKTEATSQ